MRFLDNPGDNLTHNLQPDAVLGEIEYLAPEQILDSHEADVRSDVYGLGATFYFLLTGKAPFSRHALLRLAQGVVTHPQPLSQLRPEVPYQLIAVVERMMAMSPGARFLEVADAAAAIQEWLAEVAPPPMIEPRRTSTRVAALTKTDLMPLVPEQEPEQPPAEQAEEASSPWSVLGLLAGVVALVFLGVLAARLVAW